METVYSRGWLLTASREKEMFLRREGFQKKKKVSSREY